ncbi:MAG: glycosyltransferase family 25 protein [Acidobacteriota bacterium]|nr:glycosyltransferase family 25 protein [Acidobacteriota bacterium]
MTRAVTHRPAGSINEAFPYKVCINLDRRPDRWRQMRLKFGRHGIDSVRRFPALDGDELEIPAHWHHTAGAYGCLRSHLEVVREARRLGVPAVLIFEDDVVFDRHLQQKFGAYVEQLPSDWDMLYFGALHKDEPIRVSDHVARITEANSTYAYALRGTVFDAFIELNRKAETVLDMNSLVLQRQFNCYCFMPHLAWVEDDYSDAQKRLERHWYLRESLVLFSSQVDRLLTDTTVIFAHHDHSPAGRATENLMYLVNYYHEFFSPHIAIVIVEQGVRPAVDPATLPAGCKYVFLADAGPFNRGRCFDAGVRNSDPARRFVILSDSDIYLETLDIRANLRMCERYDCATGFSKLIELTGEATLRLRDTRTTRGIDVTKNALPTSRGHRGYCRFFNREALRALGGRDESGSAPAEPLRSSRANRRLRVFQSPNHALRLRQD